MKKKEKKSEWKMKIYYITATTFRRTLELRIWGTKEEFDKEETWFDYNLTWWFYYFDDENNCNIIWLRDYNLNTLVHELIHCLENIADQVWLEMKGEPIAFIYEELFTKIMIQCGDKFKLDEDTEWFFKH